MHVTLLYIAKGGSEVVGDRAGVDGCGSKGKKEDSEGGEGCGF